MKGLGLRIWVPEPYYAGVLQGPAEPVLHLPLSILENLELNKSGILLLQPTSHKLGLRVNVRTDKTWVAVTELNLS